MYQLEQAGQFKKDIKLAKKRGLNMQLLDDVVSNLVGKRYTFSKTQTT